MPDHYLFDSPQTRGPQNFPNPHQKNSGSIGPKLAVSVLALVLLFFGGKTAAQEFGWFGMGYEDEVKVESEKVKVNQGEENDMEDEEGNELQSANGKLQNDEEGEKSLSEITEDKVLSAETEKEEEEPENKFEDVKYQKSEMEFCLDYECFIARAKTCEPTYLGYTYFYDMFGEVVAVSALYEIQGISADQCLLYFKIMDVEVTIPKFYIEEMYAMGVTSKEIKNELKDLKAEKNEEFLNKDLLCKYKPDDLVELMEDNAENLNIDEDFDLNLDLENGRCVGTRAGDRQTPAKALTVESFEELHEIAAEYAKEHPDEVGDTSRTRTNLK